MERLDRTTFNQVRTAIKRAKLPPFVRDVQVELGEDSVGAAAAWVWVLLPDDLKDRAWSSEARADVREKLRAALQDSDLEIYIRFKEEKAPHSATAVSFKE